MAYESADDFLSETLLSQAERRWANSLVNLVKPLPPFGRVIEELRRHLLSLLAGAGSPGLFGRPES